MRKEKNTTSLKLIKRFLKFLKPYRKKALFAFLFMLLAIALQLPLPFLTKYIIDKVVVMKNIKMLNIIGFVLIGVILLQSATSFLKSLLLTVFRERVLFDVKMKLYEHIQGLSLRFFHKKQTGYLMSRINSDVQSLHGLLADTILTLTQSILTFIVGIGATLYLHKQLAIIAFCILPVYAITSWLFNKRIRNMSWELREKYANVQKDLQELLTGIFTIQAFSAEKSALLRIFRSTKNEAQQSVKLSILSTLYMVISSIISSAGPLVIIWYGCAEIIRGNLTIGGLIAFNSFVHYLFGPTNTFVNINLSVQRSLASAERIFDIFDTKSEIKDKKGSIEIKSIKGNVEFKDVNFTYESEKVLESINFCVNSGENIAIVGPSGAGKSTLVNLITRFFDPDSGRILIDGNDIKNIKIKALREKIGLISQDVFLFNDTVRENIRFGSPSVKNDKVEEAAKRANAHCFIKKLEKGYNTIVGERGVTLSGGERQRISIARAILKDPKILIMDEATSQLDSESEKLIHQAISKLMKNRTTFIIAHRLSTITNADKIIVINNGRIEQIGLHQELLKVSNLYSKLYKKQMDTVV